MDYLYDKVELYDTLKNIMQGHGSTDHLPSILQGQQDIEHHLLHFLENHDEQRIASPAFAGRAEKGKPAMVVSATVSTSPTLIYFGQEVGEPGAENAGFGQPTRTSIFDYAGVPHHQRWMNGGRFDGAQLTPAERSLREFYRRLLHVTLTSPALTGSYADLHAYNRQHTPGYTDKLFSYARWNAQQKMIVVSNFSPDAVFSGSFQVPADLVRTWNLRDGAYTTTDALNGTARFPMQVRQGAGTVTLTLEPLASVILSIR
jgi:glycosidase